MGITSYLDELGLSGITPEELYWRMENDTVLFSQVIFPHHLKTGEVPEFHRKIYNLLNKQCKLTAIAAPRGFAKTTCLMIYMMQQLLYGKAKHLVYISETLDQAEEQLDTVREELENNPRIRQFWGDLTYKYRAGHQHARHEEDYYDFDYSTHTRITQKLLQVNVPIPQANGELKYVGALWRARGSGQKVRGRKKGTNRPDLEVGDDLESEESIHTPERRLGTKRWLTNAVIPSLSDNGRMIMIANYTHEDCLIKNIVESNIKKGNKAWLVKIFRAISNYDELDEDNINWDLAEPLWEKRFPIDKLLEIKNEYDALDNPEGFWQEYMNVCVSSEFRQFKRRNYYTGEYVNDEKPYLRITSRNGERVKEDFVRVNIFIGCDPAVGKSRGADYFALNPIAVDSQNNIYALQYFNKRGVDPKTAEDEVVAMYHQYSNGLKHMAVEENGFQEYLSYNLQRRLKEEGIRLQIIPIDNRSSKTGPKRIGMLQPVNEDGRFWIQENMTELRDEMYSFPNGKHEHNLDSIQMAFRFRRKPVFATVTDEIIHQRQNRRDDLIYNWQTMTLRKMV